MMSMLHRNAIITGHFDSLCLLCEVHLTDNVKDHIDVPEHKKNLQQSSYFEKYEKHHIRKVKKGYYCELCNILVSTLAQVDLHVSSIDHEKNLENSLLKQVAEGIIAFDQMFIDNEAWNGLVENSCFLCNEEFDDKSGHLKTPSHVLNLIQKQVRLKDREIIYRNVDGTIVHCLICNNIFEVSDNELHVESDQHLKNIRNSCDLKHALDIVKEHTETIDELKKQEEKHQLVIEKINNTTCVIKTKESCELKLENANRKNKNKKTLKNKGHKEEREAKDKINIEKVDSENDPVLSPFQAKEEATLLAKKNQITFKFGKQRSHCTVCNVNISSSLKKIKEHVEEIDHKTKLQTKLKNSIEKKKSYNEIIEFATDNFFSNKQKYKSDHQYMKSTLGNEFEEGTKSTDKIIQIPTEKYLKTIVECSTFDIYPKCVILNLKFCIKYLSLIMMTVNYQVIRCQACEVTVGPFDVENHRRSKYHTLQMLKTPVVISLKHEFVRKIRNKIYHCGFCNLMVGNWKDLTMHLETIEHITEKKHWQSVFIVMKQKFL